jgi:hypothetical protein
MVTILQRDKAGFQRSQHRNRADDDERRPQDEMYPNRRREFHLDQSRERYDDQAKEKNHEHGRAVPRVLYVEIKTANLARATHAQKASK